MRKLPFAILVTLGLLCATVFGFSPTRAGIQCPTAPIQTVAARDCCGRLAVRAPRSGERNFVQCRCAEKKSASQDAVVSGKVELILPEPFAFAAPQTLTPARATYAYGSREAVRFIAPPTRPPTAS